MQPTEEIAQEIIESIGRDTSELRRFIDFVKVYGIAIKLAFRCDRAASWELLGTFLGELEKIAVYRRKFDKTLDTAAKKLRAAGDQGPLQERVDRIMDEALRLKEELETYHIEQVRKRMKRHDVREEEPDAEEPPR